jgi:threonine dehydratase
MVDVSHPPAPVLPPELSPQALSETWAALAGEVMPTLFLHSQALDEALGAQVTLACEVFQRTGSFKFRGASNLIRNVANDRIVSASSGNFGQAVALASRLAGKTCTVVMPKTSSRVKVDAVRRNGATVDLVDTQKVSRMERVRQLMAKDASLFYAPPYDHPLVVAGNSTLGREICESGEEIDAVVVPVGGGGLISGVVVARDALGHPTPILGAEPLIANDAARSMQLGTIVVNDVEPQTIADGARTISLGEVTWPIVRDGVDQIVEVPEEAIAEAVRLLFRFANVKAEPTGALAVAAVATSPNLFRGKRLCCVVSGGNVDDEVYAAILRREL